MDLFDIFRNRNAETEDEQKKRVAKEIIDSVLVKIKDKEVFYSDLDKTGRDIIHYMITHEDEEKVLTVLDAAQDVNKEDKYGYGYSFRLFVA